MLRVDSKALEDGEHLLDAVGRDDEADVDHYDRIMATVGDGRRFPGRLIAHFQACCSTRSRSPTGRL